MFLRRALPLLVFLSLVRVPAVPAQDAEGAGPDTPLVAVAKEHVGTFNARRDRAENVAWKQRALALADSLTAADEPAMASECLERAGILDYYAGDLETALATWERGLEAARKSGDDKRVAALLNAKAAGISAQGDNEGALAAHFEILELRQKLGDVRGEGGTWHNIAYSQLALYRYPEAVASLRNAIRLHRKAGNAHGLAASFLSLAPRLESYVRFDEAFAIADSAVARAESIDHPQFIGTALNARGEMNHRHGRDREALADFDRALEVLATAGADKFLAAAANNRADVLASLGRLDEAAAECDRALPLLEQYGDPGHPLICRAARGRIHLRAGEYDAAERVLKEVLADFRAFADTLDDAVARAQAKEAAGASTYLSFVQSRRGRTEEAWRTVEAGLAGELRSEFAKGRPRVSLADFQAALREVRGAALVYGLATVEGLPAFLVRGDAVEAWEIDVRHGLQSAHADVLELMAAGREGPALDERLDELGHALLPPELPGDVTRLIVVPGGFASLPFEALRFEDGDLGEAFAITYAPSATTFVELEGRTGGGGGFLALADPTPGEMSEGDLWTERLRGTPSEPLPEARAEVKSIAPGRSVTLFGSDATATAFMAEVPEASIIHLATHAVVDPANPGESALVLAGGAGSAPVLLARDIDNLSLDADLVCLSSCSTAGGYQVPGEGAFGLTRSFLIAGSRTVVASWWDVEDAAGRRFMELFYEGLREGSDRDVAAQRARAVMKDEGYPRRDRMAFAVVGAVSGSLVEKLKKGPGWAANWPALAVMILVLFAVLRRRYFP